MPDSGFNITVAVAGQTTKLKEGEAIEMKKIKYLIIISALAAILFVFPASEPAYAGGNFGISFSYSVPFYDPYPIYYSPHRFGTSYGWRDDRPYWRGRYWDRHNYRFKHRYPRHYYYDRHDHGRYRGYDRW